jgi:hypothetical protein
MYGKKVIASHLYMSNMVAASYKGLLKFKWIKVK